MEEEIRRIAEQRGVRVSDEQVLDICKELSKESEEVIVGLESPEPAQVYDYVRPLEFDPYEPAKRPFMQEEDDFDHLETYEVENRPEKGWAATATGEVEVVEATRQPKGNLHNEQEGPAYASGFENRQSYEREDVEYGQNERTRPQSAEGYAIHEKQGKDVENQALDDELEDFRLTYGKGADLTNSEYQQTREYAPQMCGMLPKNKVTIEQRKFRKSDPVSNYRKYQTRWNIEGPPEERRQREWKGKVEDSVSQFMLCNGYK